jgi:DNA-binding CsgD family transcriptional regulator
MVGRSGALARLVALARDEAGPLPSLALVSGEAGIGKTRLLRELVRALPPGARVLAGQAEPGGLGRPWELVRSALEGEVPTGDDRVGAVCTALRERLGHHGVLVFEDLHWADAESVAVFERMAVSGPPGLLLIGTYRPEDLSRRLPGGEMLARLERRQEVHQLRLERLSRAEVGAFLAAVYGRPLSATVVHALHTRTGGNPFFLEELVGSAKDLEPDELADSPLPWSLAELVARQLDGLSLHERRVVEAAAVLGRRASFDVLAAMCDAGEEDLIADLRALVDRGVLVEERVDEFTFRHALVRDAVEGQLLGRERRRLHAQALDAQRSLGSSDLAQLAAHAARAGRYDELVDLAREGVGSYLACGSTYQALALATEALAEAPDDLLLLEGATRAAWLLGFNDDAAVHSDRWYHAATGPEARSKAIRLRGRVAHERGDDALVWRLVDEAKRLIDVLPEGEERAAAFAFVAQINMLQHRPDEAISWAERAADEADRVGAKRIHAQALVERASALGMDAVTVTADGLEAMHEAIAEAEQVGDWVLLSRGLNNALEMLPPGSPEQLSTIERLRDASGRAGFDAMSQVQVEIHAANWAIDAGDQALARGYVDRCGELVLIAKWGVAMWQRMLDVMLSLEEGRVARAEDLLARPREKGHEHELFWQVLEAQTALAAGRRNEARALLTAMPPSPPSYGYRNRLNTALDLAEVGAALGLDAADIRTRLVAPWMEGQPARPSVERVVEGMLASAAGNHEAVVELLAAIGDVPLPACRAASLVLLRARSLAALGRRTEATAAARETVARLERWPGPRRLAAEALVARLEGAEPDGELTAREREVAALLAEGLTNAEVAHRLYISPKTAAVHVSNILTKLGMASRAEVAAWAVRTGVAAKSG